MKPFAVYGKFLQDNFKSDLVVLPAGTDDHASTRLRALPILDSLTCKKPLSFRELLSTTVCDNAVIWFQKHLSKQHLIVARELSKKGAKIVYDCDDSGVALCFAAEPHLAFEMFHLADVIVADTPERFEWIKYSFLHPYIQS